MDPWQVANSHCCRPSLLTNFLQTSDAAARLIQEALSLPDEDVRLLLHRGARSVAEDAARSIHGDSPRPTMEETQAATRYFEAQERLSQENMRAGQNEGNSVDQVEDDRSCARSDQRAREDVQNPLSSQLDIATIAAAATGAGLRLLPQKE